MLPEKYIWCMVKLMNFLPISILAYAFNGGSLLIDKILLRTSLPKPLTYTFYVSILQLLALFLIPFGFKFSLEASTYLAFLSGLIFVLAIYSMFVSLKENEASVVGPMVGMFNPLFALILGVIFLNQFLTATQYWAFFILILGTVVLTFNLWCSKIQLNKKLAWIILSGFLFGVSYVLLRESFLQTSFLNGLVISRASAGLFALAFLLFPSVREQIFFSPKPNQGLASQTTLSLLVLGQIMGALSGLLIAFGVSLASPALVNSLFGVQYLTILTVSLVLRRKNPQLLDENLTKNVMLQKIVGVMIISLGLYLLVK